MHEGEGELPDRTFTNRIKIYNAFKSYYYVSHYFEFMPYLLYFCSCSQVHLINTASSRILYFNINSEYNPLYYVKFIISMMI